MTRLVIEEKAWSDPRLKRLANKLNVTTDFAIGKLLRLWHSSQSEGLIDCDLKSLTIWYDDVTGVDVLVEALVDSGYLKRDGDRFIIRGNRDALRAQKKRSARAKAAAVERWDKVDGTQELIAHYCACFKEKFAGKNPVITGKESGAAKTIIKTLGLARAKEAVTAYFQLRDAWYLNRLYPLVDLQQASVLNKIAVAETGVHVNATMARQAEKTSNTISAGQQWLQRALTKKAAE